MNMNNKISKDNVLFYSEKKLKDGKMHYGVGSYNRVTGITTYFSDLFDLSKDKTNQSNNN